MPHLHPARYPERAAAIAERLTGSPGQEVIVNSAGLARAITGELLRGRAGVAGMRLQTIDAFARRLVNDAGEYPRVAGDAERRPAQWAPGGPPPRPTLRPPGGRSPPAGPLPRPRRRRP